MQRFRLLACAFAFAATLPLSAKPVPKLKSNTPAELTTRVVMETSHGRIVIKLDVEKAPITVKNFLQYVDDGYYNGTIFHRVIADFMIQGGGFEKGMKEKKTRAPIKNEAGNDLSNERGSIAAARTSVPDSATAQFYINTKDNPFLDRVNSSDKVGYCVFGRVIEGMDVVDAIRRVPTKMGGVHNDIPVEDVTILAVRRLPN
jgi:cyclophilin family peptidyl-prolyl cis-trans isomerase